MSANVGLQCVIEIFPGHTHLFFNCCFLFVLVVLKCILGFSVAIIYC